MEKKRLRSRRVSAHLKSAKRASDAAALGRLDCLPRHARERLRDAALGERALPRASGSVAPEAGLETARQRRPVGGVRRAARDADRHTRAERGLHPFAHAALEGGGAERVRLGQQHEHGAVRRQRQQVGGAQAAAQRCHQRVAGGGRLRERFAAGQRLQLRHREAAAKRAARSISRCNHVVQQREAMRAGGGIRDRAARPRAAGARCGCDLGDAARRSRSRGPPRRRPGRRGLSVSDQRRAAPVGASDTYSARRSAARPARARDRTI